MADCIYHDAVAVTNCPECDFAVCQACLDGGEDGMCANCTEDRARRAQAVVAEEVARCKYCRIAEDDETPLDHDGYCGTCAALPRCATHDDLIAFDNCKSCRAQYCRKCLGFNNVCESCTAKQKAAPPRPPKPATAERPAGTGAIKRPPDGAKKPGTGPVKRPADGGPPKPKRPRPPAAQAEGAKPGAKRKKGEPELDEKGRPKKRPPSRGTQAVEAKLQSSMGGRARKQFIAVGVVVGAVAIVLLSGLVMRASSTEEQTKQVQDQMVEVHRAVSHYYKQHSRLPSNGEEIKTTMVALGVKNAKRIKITDKLAPGAVFYQLSGEEGFVIMGGDSKGEAIKTGSGAPVTLDQYATP
jgi:type II secretory pathway pseudopilin PulG